MDVPVKRASALTRKRVVIMALAVVLPAVSAAMYLKPAVPSIAADDLWISEVQQGAFSREVRGVGVLVAAHMRWVSASSAGRVERLLIKPGAWVDQHTLIAELSNPELMQALEQARWELDAAQANLLALQAQLQEQELEQELHITQATMALEAARLRERAEQPLADQHIISALNFATTQLTTRQREAELLIRVKTQARRAEIGAAQLAAEQANVRKYRNMVAHFQAQADALRITSDIEGVLQQVSVEVGQRIEAGGNIARVARPDSLLAELQVQENLVQDLQLGFPVTIDTRNGLIDGQVKRIDPRAQNGNVQVDVELFGQLPNGVRPDLSVTGTIIVEHIDNTLFINRPAGTSARSTASLFKVDDSGYAQRHSIQLGKASVSSIQVVAGLQQGDAVIVSDMSDFQQHQAVQVVQ